MLQTEAPMFYFAFGSNLDRQQMKRRCPESKLVAPATLPNHALGFTGYSWAWGGAVATVAEKRGAETEGLLYKLTDDDLRALDSFEGHPNVYRRVRKYVRGADGRRVRAYVYIRPLDEPDDPSEEYLRVIMRAYMKHGFSMRSLKRALRWS
jgi:gamma-glutamylcyclotransferase